MLKRLFLMCLLVSCLGIVSGCGGSADTPAPGNAGTGAAPTTPAADTGAPADDQGMSDTDADAGAADEGEMPADDSAPADDTEVATTTPDDNPADEPSDSAPATEEIDDMPAETADAAMMAMIQGIQDKKLQSVWVFMPPSYREEMNGMVHTLAGKMDPDIWNRTFEVLTHAVTALEGKKELILSDPSLEGAPIDAEQREKGFDAVITLLKTITECELSDLEKLKEFDGGQFLAGTGSSIMLQVMGMAEMVPGNPLDVEFTQKLANTTVTLVSSEGDAATVKVEAPGEEPKELEMVRVEGYWIPKNFADEWPGMVEQSNMQLEMISPEMIDAQKEGILAGLDQADQFITGFEAVQTQEEMQQFVSQAAAPLIAMAMGGAMGAPGAADEPADQVTVLIKGKIDDETAEKIKEALQAATDDAENYSMSELKTDELMSIEISPVGDIQAFSEKIEFGKVVDVDAEAKIITVEVGEGSDSSEENKDESEKKDESEEKSDSDSEESDSNS